MKEMVGVLRQQKVINLKRIKKIFLINLGVGSYEEHLEKAAQRLSAELAYNPVSLLFLEKCVSSNLVIFKCLSGNIFSGNDFVFSFI